MAFLWCSGQRHYDITTALSKWSARGSNTLMGAVGTSRFGDAGAIMGNDPARDITGWTSEILAPVTPARGWVGWWRTNYIGPVLGFAGSTILTIYDGSTPQISMGGTITDNWAHIYRGLNVTGPGGVELGHTSQDYFNSTDYRWTEMEWLIDPVNGYVRFRAYAYDMVTPVAQVTVFGNTQQSGAANWDRFTIWTGLQPSSDVICGDASGSTMNGLTGPKRVVTSMANTDGTVAMAPVGAGTNSGAVKEIPHDGDTSYVKTGSAGDIDRYAMQTIANFRKVDAVQLNMTARRESISFPSTLGANLLYSGVDYPAAQSGSLDITYHNHRAWSEAAPDGPWSTAKINASKFGPKRVA